MAQFERIYTSKIAPAGKDTMPFAIVVNRTMADHFPNTPNLDQNYATHMELYPEDRPSYMVSGHYDMSRSAAWQDYLDRVARYPELGVSRGPLGRGLDPQIGGGETMTDRVNITEGMTTVRFRLADKAEDYANYGGGRGPFIDVRIEGGQLYLNSSGFGGRLAILPEATNVVRVSIVPYP
jgi:hypothetical protein|tara:strand:- start:183 stop:722 length:540 start_codon:yes stop_codon:yes gene_type:complete